MFWPEALFSCAAKSMTSQSLMLPEPRLNCVFWTWKEMNKIWNNCWDSKYQCTLACDQALRFGCGAKCAARVFPRALELYFSGSPSNGGLTRRLAKGLYDLTVYVSRNKCRRNAWFWTELNQFSRTESFNWTHNIVMNNQGVSNSEDKLDLDIRTNNTIRQW